MTAPSRGKVQRSARDTKQKRSGTIQGKIATNSAEEGGESHKKSVVVHGGRQLFRGFVLELSVDLFDEKTDRGRGRGRGRGVVVHQHQYDICHSPCQKWITLEESD
ncbi:hypothetical protein WMY93_019613 [Mugilogobius chulae]|uniref:Uncharacterized protein n=1 Tax=Mugilogobius chulae TaxID=88201 RepID=A0AAW0NJN4_9GOBI